MTTESVIETGRLDELRALIGHLHLNPAECNIMRQALDIIVDSATQAVLLRIESEKGTGNG